MYKNIKIVGKKWQFQLSSLSRSAYWRLENGENYSLKTLIKVCKVLGVTLEEFFHGVDCPKP
jgi:transcriptional regulator with XRE-family HTH domain